MAYTVLAYVVMAYILMPYIVMAFIVMAYIVMAFIVMAYIVMAYIIMASKSSTAVKWLATTTAVQRMSSSCLQPRFKSYAMSNTA